MKRSGTKWLLGVHAVLLALSLRPAHAQPPVAPPPGVPSAEQAAATAAEAKELNRQGIAMLDAGDLERALEYFVKSRKVLPTTKNTTNTAIALSRLGRYDEALELYEELLLKYAGGLDDEDRAAIAPAMAELREKVGSVLVSSSVGGEVFVDGRSRGKLPLVTPLRVLAGKHSLRVTRLGFGELQRDFEVGAGASISIEAALEPLRGVGQLLVEEASGAPATVFVDGTELGPTPWEMSLPPGEHLVWLRSGADRGSAPTVVEVIDGQAALSRLPTHPLGPPMTIRVEPRTARYDIGGLLQGSERWEGRLPVSSYVLTVSEPGYRTSTQRLEVAAGGAPIVMNVRLEVDPRHPRWPQPEGAFLVELYGGPMLGPSLGGDADAGCPELCAASSSAVGLQVGLRGGYRFPFGLAIELGGGFISLGQSIERTETSNFGEPPTTVTYELLDDVSLRGPFGAVGASWRTEFSRFFAGGRASVGVLVSSSRDAVEGTASTTGPSVPLNIERPNDRVASAAPFLSPELFGGVRLGPVDLGLSLGLSFFPADGPEVGRGRFGPRARDDVSDPAAVENVPESSLIEGEQTYGAFWAFTPAVTAATTF